MKTTTWILLCVLGFLLIAAANFLAADATNECIVSRTADEGVDATSAAASAVPMSIGAYQLVFLSGGFTAINAAALGLQIKTTKQRITAAPSAPVATGA